MSDPSSSATQRAHPYIPNSAAAARDAMLHRIGVASTEDLYAAIPSELRLADGLDLPEPLVSEQELARHVLNLLNRNTDCQELLNFRGGGCWEHYVPAVCDEVVGRAEFLSAYGGGTYGDLGKYQAIFEFQSMLGELLDMEVVSAPSYDWATAAASSLLMSARITGRSTILVPSSSSPEMRGHLPLMAPRDLNVVEVPAAADTGLLDTARLEALLDAETAALYVEMPSYLGPLEPEPAEIARLVHDVGALMVVGVDPITLGVLTPPSAYGADIVCGDAQPLGNHMLYGGGVCGFIASRDDPRIVAEYPTFLISIAPALEGEAFGFGWSTTWRMSYERREESSDFTGSSQWLWGIAAAVYMALMGPAGMREVGETILARAHYAASRLSELPGVRAPALASPFFKDFTVDFAGTGLTVAEINSRLLAERILGGTDLSLTFPEFGDAALYSVTEQRDKGDIDRLVEVLGGILA